MASTATASIYDTITNQIIAALERGTGDYTLPWHRSSAPLTRPINAVTRKAYRGVNVLALWASAEAQDFGHGLWATYRQWQSLGAQVRKGEKASPIVFYKVLDKPEGSEDEAREGAGRIFAQGSQVFNIAQVEGYALPEVPEAEAFDPVTDVETFIAATGAAIRNRLERVGGADLRRRLALLSRQSRVFALGNTQPEFVALEAGGLKTNFGPGTKSDALLLAGEVVLQPPEF